MMQSLFRRLDPEEIELDAQAVADVIKMYRSEPVLQMARDSFLSMVLPGPFTFTIPKMGLKSNQDMQRVIEHYWLPWQRTVYDWVKMFGICPYYFETHGGHPTPVVPNIDLGLLSVTITKDHKLKYKWRWNHGSESEEAKNMHWIITEYAPDRYGRLQSPINSLLGDYRTLLILRQSLEVASSQCARPTHVMEYHPSAGMGTARNDHMNQLTATLGEKVAGLHQGRQEAAKAQEIRMRTGELMRQLRDTEMSNTIYDARNATRKRLLWTDLEEDAVDRYDAGLASRIFPLRPDFKYVAPQKASIVANLVEHQRVFNITASARMDYSLEFVQPTGVRGGTNMRGAERFENERTKEALSFFERHTKSALVIAYRKQFEQAFEQAKRWRLTRNTGAITADDIAQMYPELDVEVHMECTPFINYTDLRAMWLDGLMDKETFARHAFHLHALPKDEIHIGPQLVDGGVQTKKKKSKPE